MPTRAEHALEVWPILVEAARQKRTLTYSDIASKIGGIAQGVGQYLKPIEAFCKRKKLPALTLVVVQKRTGLPGPGLTAAKIRTHEDLKSAIGPVFDFDWFTVRPSLGDLDQSR